MTGGWSDDDALLRELGEALDEADDVPERVAQSGRDLYTWLTIDAELSELAYDSAEGAEGVLVRAEGQPRRSLSFRSTRLTIELDVERDPGALRGQLTVSEGELPREVLIETLDGEPVSVPVDEVGYFAADPFAVAGARLRLRCGDAVTPWIF
jgi:hypothetical protein